MLLLLRTPFVLLAADGARRCVNLLY